MKKNISFEEAIKSLDDILTKLEDENISLDESLKLFEEGNKLSSLCYDKLKNAEQKIIDIKATDNKVADSCDEPCSLEE